MIFRVGKKLFGMGGRGNLIQTDPWYFSPELLGVSDYGSIHTIAAAAAAAIAAAVHLFTVNLKMSINWKNF
jgi:hypothetical protein